MQGLVECLGSEMGVTGETFYLSLRGKEGRVLLLPGATKSMMINGTLSRDRRRHIDATANGSCDQMTSYHDEVYVTLALITVVGGHEASRPPAVEDNQVLDERLKDLGIWVGSSSRPTATSYPSTTRSEACIKITQHDNQVALLEAGYRRSQEVPYGLSPGKQFGRIFLLVPAVLVHRNDISGVSLQAQFYVLDPARNEGAVT